MLVALSFHPQAAERKKEEKAGRIRTDSPTDERMEHSVFCRGNGSRPLFGLEEDLPALAHWHWQCGSGIAWRRLV